MPWLVASMDSGEWRSAGKLARCVTNSKLLIVTKPIVFGYSGKAALFVLLLRVNLQY